MLHKASLAEIHLSNITACLKPTVTLLMNSISPLAPLFCRQLQAQYCLLLRRGRTLHKIHTFVEMQQDRYKIKYLFRQSEMNKLLGDCRAGVKEALEVFKVESGPNIFNSGHEMERKSEIMHRAVQELIANLSESTGSDGSSSVCTVYSDLEIPCNSKVRSIRRPIATKADGSVSSNSFTLLPPRLKIFHGRESELEHIIKILTQDTARISIIGGGGMGKTSLARATLHHPEIATKYEKRLFVTCDSAQNSIELAAQIGSHIGLQPGKDLRQAVVKSLSSAESFLLILDNLETPWEPLKSRSEIEEFLARSDLPHLALLITMRGAKRPAKVAWTRLFLQTLEASVKRGRSPDFH
ncbi:hypothetical protein B0H13DRAFT_1892221 [Mycena leptocephala]|nr:hypothetical protein B0H13DRAFT_1892221 [Mycena leptocephala]